MWSYILEVERLDAPSADGTLGHVESGTSHDEVSCQSPGPNTCLCMQSQCQQVHIDSCVSLLPSDGHAVDAILHRATPAVDLRQRQFDHLDATMPFACGLSTGD